MSYETILVHADLSRHAPLRYAKAAQLARAHAAHLIGAALSGISPLVVPAEQCGLPGGVLDAYFGAMRAQLQVALAAFETAVAPSGCSYDKRVVIDDAGAVLAALGRFADLVVVSRDDPDEARPRSDARLAQFLILHTPWPVMVVPLTTAAQAEPSDMANTPACILVVWNGSRQAAAAVDQALPLLRQASVVVVAAFDEDAFVPPAAADDGADLLAYLSRHGVHASFERRAEPVDMGHALIDMARQRGADLIVAGCFGHARLREMALGGVSRTLLSGSPIALLMAHT